MQSGQLFRPRFDYCNSVLAGLPKSTIAPLQRVQNAAARLIGGLGPHDHVTPAVYELHWLPVEQRVTSKLCTLMHLMSEQVTSTSSIASRSRLRSASNRRYEQPTIRLKLGERSYAFASPAVWNSLLTSFHEITNHTVFKRELKTELFKRTYIVHNYRISTFSLLCYAPLFTLRCSLNGVLEMTFMNYELSP
jgi:hypothetical protein